MNPISGTLPARRLGRATCWRFLADPKEIDELYMVLDEELKMMATVAEHGGQVVGPYLKEMAHLTHTEYLLAGRGSLDVRDVLRETMFAPTVTGSPIENACRVIARHERRGRGYYAGVLALLGHDDVGPADAGRADPDPHRGDHPGRRGCGCRSAPRWCGTPPPAGEVAETHTKAAGVLAALGLAAPAGAAVGRPASGSPTIPAVRAALAARNAHLARFWLDARATRRAGGARRWPAGGC